MSSSERNRQKSAEKQKRRREKARANAKKGELPTSARALIKLAASRPFGPAWMSQCVHESESEPPRLVFVALTRTLPRGLLLAHLLTVDRTCLGIREATVLQPMDELTLERYVLATAPAESKLVRCEVDLARSVVFHAIDYARSLGFEPHADLATELVGARPEPLVDTPYARPPRPRYVARPGEDSEWIRRRLERAVGPHGYDFVDASGLKMRDVARALVEEFSDRGEGPPEDDVLEGLDLDEQGDLMEAVHILEDMLERGTFLQWEAVVREERGLPLSEAQEHALEGLVDFSDDDEDEPILYIDDCARPTEPWYETVRRVAERLVIERFDTKAPGLEERAVVGSRLLRAVEAHADDLSLPDGCREPVDVIPPHVRHRLHVQCAFDALSGLGLGAGKHVISLDGSEGAERIEWFAKTLIEHAPSLAALGWTWDSVLSRVLMPESDRQRLLDGLKGYAPEGASRDE